MSEMSVLERVEFVQPPRPWLSLYGKRVRPVSPVGSISRLPPELDPSVLHRTLPDELLYEIFVRLNSDSLGRGACVCRKWRYAISGTPALWRRICLEAWQIHGVQRNENILRTSYQFSWRKMWLERPRLRFDGLYVSRNTYLRTGIMEWHAVNPVHLVCYYRYMRFYPSGKCLYKTSPNKLSDVAKIIRGRPSKSDSVFAGRYALVTNRVETAIIYPGSRPTLLRVTFRLRGTSLGANNRMDVLSLTTSGVQGQKPDLFDSEVFDASEGWDAIMNGDPDGFALSHERGKAAFVYVPFEQVETSFLNLPVESMEHFNTY